MDTNSLHVISQVDPVLEEKIQAAVAQIATDHGIEVRAIQGYRTFAEQDKIYAQGRTLPGNIVSNTPGGYSSHNFGLAVDLCPGLLGKLIWTPNWNASDPAYGFIAEACKAQGLKWGGDWIHFKDIPHFYIGPDNPTAQMRADMMAHGIQYVWDQVAAGAY